MADVPTIVTSALWSRREAESWAKEGLVEQFSVRGRAKTMDLVSHEKQMWAVRKGGAECVRACCLHRREHDTSAHQVLSSRRWTCRASRQSPHPLA